MVGLSMASGDWETVGQGLEPGQAYALNLNGQADRLKLELTNIGSDAVASFSVYAPDGQRAGFFGLDANTKAAEVVATKGVWTLFVYKTQGADLQVLVHGAPDAGKFLPADVERREVVLGNFRTQTAVDETFTAVIGKEPVLANVYLKGSARNFGSELRTEKGVVEIIRETEVAAAQTGLIVDSKGERMTMPQNLQAGPFTAKVQADSLSGSLVLVTLFVVEPDFDLELPDEREMNEDGSPPEPPRAPRHKERPHAHNAPKAPPAHPGHPMEMEFQECGTAESRVPYGIEMNGGMLRLTLEESVDPWVTVFDPLDQIHAVVQLEEQGDMAEVPIGMPGEYVIYSRGMNVKVEALGSAECELRELSIEAASVGVVSIRGGGDAEQVPFSLTMAPLEFGVRMTSPDAVGIGVEAVFTGPAGEAARYQQSFGLGPFSDNGLWLPLPFGGDRQERGNHGYAEVDSKLLVSGDWLLDVNAEVMNGDLEAYALHYLREAAEEDEGN